MSAAAPSVPAASQTETASSGCRSAQQHSTHRTVCTLTATPSSIHPCSSNTHLHPPSCLQEKWDTNIVHPVTNSEWLEFLPLPDPLKNLYNGDGDNKHSFTISIV